VAVRIYKVNSPTFNINLAVYSDTGSNAPDSALGTSTTTKAASELTADTGGEEVKFGGLDVSIIAETRYWIVLYASAHGDTNYVNWHALAAAFGNYTYKDVDATSFVLINNSQRMRYTTYA
jgi:hypothetical protein